MLDDETRRALGPVYERAQQVQGFAAAHPEAAYFYGELYGRGAVDEIWNKCRDLQKGIYNPSAVMELVETLLARLKRLAAPADKVN